MPKWQNLYVTYLQIYCVLLYQHPPLGHQSPGACSLSCQPAPSESKWRFLVCTVQTHFVMSRSVRVSVAAPWCCHLPLPSGFWQKQTLWHRGWCQRARRVTPQGRGSQEQHSADHHTSLHDPVYNVSTADWAGEDSDFLHSLWSNLVLKEKQFPNRWPQGRALAMPQSPNCCSPGREGREGDLQRVKAQAKQKSGTV